MLLGCDGIWETYTVEEICDIIDSQLEKNNNLEKILTEFLDMNLAEDTSRKLLNF